MKNSKNNNIILGFGYWVLEFGFSWCKGKIISSIPFLMRFVALQNKNLFLTHFFLRIMSHLLKNVYRTHSYTPKTYKIRIEKHKIFKCVCLSSFWNGCAKKDRKIYPLNLSILQQITVNGVNFCTAYLFGRLD